MSPQGRLTDEDRGARPAGLAASSRLAATDAEARAHAAVLHERARRLARRAPAAAPAPERLQVLAFSVAGRRLLLDLACLCEVRPLQSLLPVPLTRAPLLGFWLLRDKVLPVLDLPRLLEAEPGADPRFALAIGDGAPGLALPADAVHGVETLSPPEVQARTAPLQGLRPEIVRGLTAAGELWLDAARLLQLQPNP